MFQAMVRLITASLAMILLLTACAGGPDQPVSSGNGQYDPANPGNGTEIVGTVTDADGQPLGDVSISVVSGTSAVREMAMLTDADGVYTWTVPAGTYTLLAYKEGYGDLSLEVTVAEGKQATLDFQLELAP